MPSTTIVAQDAPATHAHSTSMKWKGIDVEKVLKSSDSDTEYEADGKKIYLYNVGTGRFIIEGGNWGVEGRLFHEDFGRQMTLLPTGRIHSGITEANINANKNSFGLNIPRVTRNAGWDSYTIYSFTPIMDGALKYSAWPNTIPDERHWNFYRVETDPDADTYTYYMSEKLKNQQKVETEYWLGAIYGKSGKDGGQNDFYQLDEDPDRSAWTSAEVRGNMELKQVGNDMVTIDELYQWRLISQEEFLAVLNEEIIGINPSVSSLVPDRDFSRNSDDFKKWVTERKADGEYSNDEGRYGYTWGNPTQDATKQQPKFNNEPWNAPVRLKEVFDDKTSGQGSSYGWRNSKYGYLSFEGEGTVHTSFEVPNPGWYQVECYGFCQSESNHTAYLYAKVEGSSSTTSNGSYSSAYLRNVAAGTYQKNAIDKCLVVGQELTTNGEAYKAVLWICVTDADFNSGNKTLQVGFGKDEATKSATYWTNGGKNYYYDTDWVCVDDIRVSYMGIAPVFFYEDEESLDYLRFSEENFNQYPSTVPNGRYGGAANLERTMKTGQWNSFSFPIHLTGEQVRYAFGENAVLAKIHSVGKLTKNSNVIDFETVDLMTTDPVVEPGHFYLLRPTNEPIFGKDPRGNEAYYYKLGRTYFSVNAVEDDTYPYDLLPLSTVKAQEPISSYRDANDGIGSVNYVQTPGFEDFTVTDGIYDGTVDVQGVYAPKGSYGVSNNTIYHLNKDTRIKGFRGWITLTHEVLPGEETHMAVDGIIDWSEPSGITDKPFMPLSLPDDTSVYDMSGRCVGIVGSALPKGIYIVRGKKYIVP